MIPGDFQSEKQLVMAFYAALDKAALEDLPNVLQHFMVPDLRWRGLHPFNEMCGAEAVASNFWQPLRQSLTRMQRRMDIFLSGRNEIEP